MYENLPQTLASELVNLPSNMKYRTSNIKLTWGTSLARIRGLAVLMPGWRTS